MPVETGTINQAVLTNLASLVPVKMVRSYQQGVRFSFGKDTGLLEYGMHWYVPFFQSIEILDTVPQVVNLPTQSLITKDNRNVCVSSAMEYQIMNVRRLYREVQDPDKSLVNTGMGYLGRHVRVESYDFLRNNSLDLESRIKGEMNERVRNWGVRVNQFYITDLVEANQFRLFSDISPGLKTIQ